MDFDLAERHRLREVNLDPTRFPGGGDSVTPPSFLINRKKRAEECGVGGDLAEGQGF